MLLTACKNLEVIFLISLWDKIYIYKFKLQASKTEKGCTAMLGIFI